MREVLRDYYTGFEGEPEIGFVRRNGQGHELVFTLWYGYFYTVMELVVPGPTGWTALALPYHLVEGWYDDPDWLVPDVPAVIAQLDALDRAQLPEQERKILDELITFMREGLTAGDRLFIQYF